MHQNQMIATPGVDYEQWENASGAMIVLRKMDTLGRITEEKVAGGRNVQITPGERRYNQEQCASEDLDVFKNGLMRPVRLLDSEEDSAVLQANVNAMSESTMRALFNTPIRAFSAKVREVSNPIALQRFLELAQDDAVEATVKQVEVLKGRLNEIRPPIGEVSVSGGVASTKAPPTEGAIRGVTPR